MRYIPQHVYRTLATVHSWATSLCDSMRLFVSREVKEKVIYIVVPISLLILAVAVYWTSMDFPFEFDDLPNIVKYFHVRHETLKTLWCSSARWVSHWLNVCCYAYSPENNKFCPFLYRLLSLFIHCSTGIFVYISIVLAQRLANAQSVMRKHGLFIAALATGIFLLHPVQTQTVSYVVQAQLEGVMCLCLMALICAFMAYNLALSSLARCLWLLMMAFIVTVGCGAKEIFIIAPVMVLLIDYFFVAQGDIQQMKYRWLIHIGILTLVIGWYLYYLKPHFFVNVFGLRTVAANNIGNLLTERREQVITPWLFFISQGKVLLHYAGLFVWPFFMSVDYDWKLCRTWFDFDCIIPYACLIVLFGYFMCRLLRRRDDIISFCGMWFFASLLPRASFIPATELIADYKTYVGSYGVAIMMAYILVQLYTYLECYAVRITYYLNRSWYAVLIMVFLGLIAYQRNLVWKTPLAFWKHIIEAAPRRARGYNNYGTALCDVGKYEEAVRYFKYAISLDGCYPDPWTNLSVAYVALRKVDDAIASARRALLIMPMHVECHNNLASLLIFKAKYDEAEFHCRESLRLRPHYGKARVNLGKIALHRKRYEEAWDEFRRACLESDFDTLQGFILYGDTSFSLKKFDHAIIAYTKALSFDRSKCEAQAVRRVYAAGHLKRYDDVERWVHDWMREFPHSINMMIAYADILFEQRRYAESLAWYQRAIDQHASHLYSLYKKACCYDAMNDKQQAYTCVIELLKSPEKNDPVYKKAYTLMQRLEDQQKAT